MANRKRRAEEGDGISQTAKKVQCLNVGGQLLTTSIDTLTKYPDSKLGKMFTPGSLSPATNDDEGNYFIDRDGSYFKYVLNFLRSGKLYLPTDFTDFEQLRAETVFFGLEEMRKLLDIYQQTRNAKETIWIKITTFDVFEHDKPTKLSINCLSNTFYSIPFPENVKENFNGSDYNKLEFNKTNSIRMSSVKINVNGYARLFFDIIAKRGFGYKGIHENGSMIYEREL